MARPAIQCATYQNPAGERRQVISVIDDGATRVAYLDANGGGYCTIRAFRAWLGSGSR